MEQPTWDEVARHFDEARALEPAARAAYLADLNQAALRSEVEALLAAETRDEFLTPPLADSSGSSGSDGLIGVTIGGFRIVERLGEGGMGAVYAAEQASPKRSVALKVLRSAFASASVRRRFQVEAEILGRLHHPNVAEVYDAGVHVLEAGFELPYFAMERVEGARHLTDYADEQQLDLRARLELMLHVLDAVDAAHRRGILHRDLKPSNLLVDGEGRVKVIDFGVGRADDDSLLTRTGEIIGTPAFMSPEQLSGRPEDVDAQSDVWALGVVLYLLTTGTLPFDVDGKPVSQLAHALEVAAPFVSRRSPLAPRDLDHVVAKALEHDRARRYRSAAELADELKRVLANEPVLAVPASPLYRLTKFAARNRLLVGAGVGVALALVVGSLLATLGLLRARTAESEAKRGAEIAAEEAAKFAAVNRVLTSMFTSIDASRDGAELRVVDLLASRAEDLPLELAQQPRVAKALHLVLAESLLSLGQIDPALREAQAALALARAEGPLDEPDDVNAIRLAAEAHIFQGDLDDARALVTEGRGIVLAPSPAASDVADRLDLVAGNLAHRERRFDEALATFRALAERATDERLVFDARYLEAETLLSADRLDECAEAYERYADALSAAPVVDEFRLATARLGWCGALLPLGRTDEIRETLPAVVTTLARLTGATSPHTRRAINFLASAEVEAGDLEEARALLEALVEDAAGEEANSHEVANARQQLALLSSLLGEKRRGTNELRLALDAARAIYGEDDPKTAKAMTLLGVHLTGVRELAEAEELLLAALDLRQRQNTPSPLERLGLLGRLGELYYAKGDFQAAFDHLEPAWRGFEELLGPDAPRTSSTGSNAVAALTQLGDVKRAAPIAESLLHHDRERLGPGDPAVLVQTVNLSIMYDRLGRSAESETLLTRALAAGRSAKTDDRPEFADVLFARARQLIAKNQPEPAAAACRDALTIRANATPRNPIAEGMTQLELGRALSLLDRPAEALTHLESAHRSLSPAFPPTAPHMTSLIQQIAAALDSLDRSAEAQTWRERLAKD